MRGAGGVDGWMDGPQGQSAGWPAIDGFVGFGRLADWLIDEMGLFSLSWLAITVSGAQRNITVIGR